MDKFLVTGSYLHSQKEEIIPRTDGDKPRDKVSANGSACAALTMSVEDKLWSTSGGGDFSREARRLTKTGHEAC